MTVREDLILTGPFFTQRKAGLVLVNPRGGGNPVSLGSMAAAAGPNGGLRLSDATSAAGLKLTGTAAAGAFGITMTPGTTLALVGEVASGSTVTDKVVFDLVLPAGFPTGKNLTVSVNAQAILTAGATLSASQVIVDAYSISSTGSSSATLAGGTITVGTVAATGTATITGTTLVPGSHLLVQLTGKAIETAGTAAHLNINSVSLANS